MHERDVPRALSYLEENANALGHTASFVILGFIYKDGEHGINKTLRVLLIICSRPLRVITVMPLLIFAAFRIHDLRVQPL